MSKIVLFLEDNPSTVSALRNALKRRGYEVALAPSINNWKTLLTDWAERGKKPDLLLIDDNLYHEPNLAALGGEDIPAGADGGVALAQLILGGGGDPIIQPLKNVPIVVYTIHSENRIKRNLGATFSSISYSSKDVSADKLTFDKCIELLGDAE